MAAQSFEHQLDTTLEAIDTPVSHILLGSTVLLGAGVGVTEIFGEHHFIAAGIGLSIAGGAAAKWLSFMKRSIPEYAQQGTYDWAEHPDLFLVPKSDPSEQVENAICAIGYVEGGRFALEYDAA